VYRSVIAIRECPRISCRLTKATDEYWLQLGEAVFSTGRR
jgi:hypothetical protein